MSDVEALELVVLCRCPHWLLRCCEPQVCQVIGAGPHALAFLSRLIEPEPDRNAELPSNTFLFRQSGTHRTFEAHGLGCEPDDARPGNGRWHAKIDDVPLQRNDRRLEKVRFCALPSVRNTLADEPIETMSDGGPSCFTKVTKSRPTALEGKRIQVLDACRCAGVRYSGSFGLWPNTFQCVESAAHHGSGSGELPSTCLESRELAGLTHCAVLLLQPRTPERSARALPQLSALDRGRAP